jgi:hypothetical protein
MKENMDQVKKNKGNKKSLAEREAEDGGWGHRNLG